MSHRRGNSSSRDHRRVGQRALSEDEGDHVLQEASEGSVMVRGRLEIVSQRARPKTGIGRMSLTGSTLTISRNNDAHTYSLQISDLLKVIHENAMKKTGILTVWASNGFSYEMTPHEEYLESSRIMQRSLEDAISARFNLNGDASRWKSSPTPPLKSLQKVQQERKRSNSMVARSHLKACEEPGRKSMGQGLRLGGGQLTPAYDSAITRSRERQRRASQMMERRSTDSVIRNVRKPPDGTGSGRNLRGTVSSNVVRLDSDESSPNEEIVSTEISFSKRKRNNSSRTENSDVEQVVERVELDGGEEALNGQEPDQLEAKGRRTRKQQKGAIRGPALDSRRARSSALSDDDFIGSQGLRSVSTLEDRMQMSRRSAIADEDFYGSGQLGTRRSEAPTETVQEEAETVGVDDESATIHLDRRDKPESLSPIAMDSQESGPVVENGIGNMAATDADQETVAEGNKEVDNTSYAGAVFQSLMSLLCFKQMLRNSCRNHNENRNDFLALYLLEMTKKDASAPDQRNLKPSIDPRKGLEILFSEDCQYSQGIQEDAQELFLAVLCRMEKELAETIIKRALDQGLPKYADPVTKTFSCVIRRCCACVHCGFKGSPRFELHKDLSLDLPNPDPVSREVPSHVGGAKARKRLFRMKLKMALVRYFDQEKVSKACEKCDGEESIQETSVGLLPQVLVLHLKRTQTEPDGSLTRLQYPVSPPMYLNLAKFATNAYGPDLFVDPTYKDEDVPSPVESSSEEEEDMDWISESEENRESLPDSITPGNVEEESKESGPVSEENRPEEVESHPRARKSTEKDEPTEQTMKRSEKGDAGDVVRAGKATTQVPQGTSTAECINLESKPELHRGTAFDVCKYVDNLFRESSGKARRSVCARYRLQCIVRHDGASAAGGNCFADIRNPLSGLWYEYNGGNVQPIASNWPYPDRARQETSNIYFYVHQRYLA